MHAIYKYGWIGTIIGISSLFSSKRESSFFGLDAIGAFNLVVGKASSTRPSHRHPRPKCSKPLASCPSCHRRGTRSGPASHRRSANIESVVANGAAARECWLLRADRWASNNHVGSVRRIQYYMPTVSQTFLRTTTQVKRLDSPETSLETRWIFSLVMN